MMLAETREEIERRAIEITAELDAHSHTLKAEIDPSVSPAWYVVITTPDGEGLALKHLLRRSFGLFDPMFDERVIDRGRSRIRRTRLLPGYLLAFVWNIDAQWPRMASCPGVYDLMRRPGTQYAAIVPDVVIDYLQGLEISRSLNNTDPGWAGVDKPTRKQKRRGRKNGSRVRESIAPVMVDDIPPDEIIIRCKSYLGGIDALAVDERISSFAKAIGLG